MSIEINSFVRSREPIPVEDVAGLAASAGWAVRLLDQNLAVTSSRDLADGLIVGWRTDAAVRDELAARSHFVDDERLQALYADGALAAAQLFFNGDFDLSEELEPDEIEDLREELEGWQVSEMQASKQRANLHTSAGRSDASVALQVVVAAAICGVHGGLLEDPQDGDIRLFEATSSLPSLEDLGV